MVVKFFHFFRVVCVVKGFEDGFYGTDSLPKLVRRAVHMIYIEVHINIK
jgi:hypothetical protein